MLLVLICATGLNGEAQSCTKAVMTNSIIWASQLPGIFPGFWWRARLLPPTWTPSPAAASKEL